MDDTIELEECEELLVPSLKRVDESDESDHDDDNDRHRHCVRKDVPRRGTFKRYKMSSDSNSSKECNVTTSAFTLGGATRRHFFVSDEGLYFAQHRLF
eukprot:CAMPEP_0203647316 /NCGR_PEP_ID=MMETSP0088-20131115/15440_1 /ASSEMBLY_ACC=CAM_ASM_001087 /TAXON_ID=426623 /ORGANISM="Chaetoceros affinis, Strain CCMP159" /LENGTH=97 /DNA_ID=CAMNT_0050504909 /DNA_START=244 /DNA_END=537 /DNA_ORIENTATION=-